MEYVPEVLPITEKVPEFVLEKVKSPIALNEPVGVVLICTGKKPCTAQLEEVTL